MATRGADVNDTSRYGDSKPTVVSAEEVVRPEDVPGIVNGLRRAFRSEKTMSAEWRRGQLKAFKRMITECEKELCEAMHADLHKSHFEGFATELMLVHSEVDTALDELDEWMKPTKKGNSALNVPGWATTQRDPLGVCLIMGAWNYPVQLQLAPLVGCIAGGNCAILKPGSYAQATSNAIARVVKRYMDPECFQVIEGNRETTNALLAEKFDLVFFTGSAFVGKIVARACAEHLTPCVLELGGKSPCVVDKSANLAHTVKRLVWAKFLNAGQTCVANDFLMVHEDIADQLLEAVQRTIIEFYSSDASKTEWFGRLINDAAYKRLAKLVEGERDRIVIGGDVKADERFIAPTVFDFKNDFEAFKSSELMADELFGPLLPVYRYRDLEQVIDFIKDLPTGKPLALYAYGTDSRFIAQIKNRTTSGGLCINDSLMHLANHELPFGGVGNSGMGGGYHGKYSFDRFTHEKAVLEKVPALDESILSKPLLDTRFPPYNNFKKQVVRSTAAHFLSKAVNMPLPALRFLAKVLIAYVFLTRVAGYRIVRE